ncbi:hypothetical protein FACS189499_04740 [Clostridia bacterium]|nr:hypothetical protein FACS189499_04740 [Clostridia bacterium]
MIVLIALVVGVLIGCILMTVIGRTKVVGTLRMDRSDPDDDPYLFLELSKRVDIIYRKKYVTMKVNTENLLSHK